MDFRIPAGTVCFKIQNNTVIKVNSKAEVFFGKEDVTVDPFGKLGDINPTSGYINGPTVGADFCKRGYYGFQHDLKGNSRTIFVAANLVEYIG